MAEVVVSKKSCAENPLKSSTPLGAALAFLGVEGSVPLFHGSQGCTSFALVLAVRHFKEAVPLQTTAMNEPATVLGGADNLEEALLVIANRMKPRFIGVASTALVETRGEDFTGELKSILAKRRELDSIRVVFASTPDFEGALEDGWAKATTAIIDAMVPPGAKTSPARVVNILPGVHETPGTIEEVRALCESFGLTARVVPDLSGSLDGHVPEQYIGTSLGGAKLTDIEALGDALHTIAIGEHMRGAAELSSERTGVPSTVLPTLLGLRESDELIALLAEVSGVEVPPRIRRERSRLVDAMLDGHFHLSGKRVAIAADPDLLASLTRFFHGLGALVEVAIASTKNSPLLAELPCEQVVVGDLGDFEERAGRTRCDLLVTHSHGNLAAEALDIPLFRVGFPIFDRLGHQHRSLGGYVGTRELIYEVANELMGLIHEHKPEDFASAVPPTLVLDTRHDLP